MLTSIQWRRLTSAGLALCLGSSLNALADDTERSPLPLVLEAVGLQSAESVDSEDKSKEGGDKQNNESDRDDEAEAKYWIGVALKVVDGEGGLEVLDVIPGSPAEAAGLKVGDVITRFGKQETKDPETILDLVNRNKQRRVDMTFRRGDVEKTVKVKPVPRPETGEDVVRDVNRMLEQAYAEAPEDATRQGWGMFRFAPGWIAPFDGAMPVEFPKNLAVSITRNDDELAIRVEYKGKTYEVNEKQIDELPAEVRDVVRRLIQNSGIIAAGAAFVEIQPEIGAFGPGQIVPAPQAVPRVVPPGAVRPAPHLPGSRIQIQPFAPAGLDAGKLDQILKELHSLREEVESLRKSVDKTQDGEASPDSESESESESESTES